MPHPLSPAGQDLDWSTVQLVTVGSLFLPRKRSAGSVWEEIERRLIEMYALPHNKRDLAAKGQTPEAAARVKLREVRSGMHGDPKQVEYTGPKFFMRWASKRNRAYSGEWWFDADMLANINASFSRIFFNSADRKSAIRDLMREVLAISTEWNSMTEVWVLELPGNETLVGFSAPGARQKLFADLPLSEKANRMLVGRAEQIFFPVKNPLWINLYDNF